MNEIDLKRALLSKEPVIWVSKRYGTGRYKCVKQIIHYLGADNKIKASAVLEDYNDNAYVQVAARELAFEKEPENANN